jgi:sugar lactone lactonase YvrE
MFSDFGKSFNRGKMIALVLLALMWAAPANLYGDKKKKAAAPAAPKAPVITGNFSNVVFPLPPAVTRLKYLDYFSAEMADLPKSSEKKVEKKSASWMDRLAGVAPENDSSITGAKRRFQLLTPYGLAVDSKGLLYVADTKVGAIFIFNTENNSVELIKNGAEGHFKAIIGLAMDDNDTLLVSDTDAHHVLVFDSKHKLQTSFGEGVMDNPCGVAIDFENRLLYVVDVGLDQVLVYDADSYKLLRRIGTTGKNHTLTDEGNFSKPTNVAVGKDGLVFVTDTLNDRVEVFDADGNFVRTWGKNGDGPGDFARPKGIAIDSDGHVWVADAMLNRVQAFTPEGYLLLAFGSFGILPGQFQALTGLAIDQKNHRVFTAEQLLGRVQMYRYFTNDEARAELASRQDELKKKAEERAASQPTAPAKAGTAPAAVATPAAETEAPAQPTQRMKLPEPAVPAQAAGTPAK